MTPRKSKDRTFRVFNLLPSDRKGLKDIKEIEELPNRHEALERLIPIVQSMDLEKLEQGDRKPIRLGIPDELHKAINDLKKKTGQTYISILVEAAREYKRLHSE